MKGKHTLSIGFLSSIFGSLFLISCAQAPPPGPPQSDCKSDHHAVGSTAELKGHAHGISGTVTITDNCTIRIDNFHYDGGGLSVVAYGANNKDFKDGVVLSNDLKRLNGYKRESVEFKLPLGVQLKDVKFLSIWCYSMDMSLGDAEIF